MSYEQFLMALCIWREARGTPKLTMQCIREVLENRAKDSSARWPRIIPAVILQHAQFSSFSAGDPNAVKFPLPGSGPDWTAWMNCEVVVTDPPSSVAGGANHYESCEPDKLPSWADPAKITLQLGPFRFYKL